MEAASGAAARSTVTILGIPVDVTDMPSTMAALDRFVGEGGFHHVITADSSGLYRQLQDSEFRDILLQSAWVTPDSSGVLWAARQNGATISERVSGVDIVEEACALSARTGCRLYFLGSSPGVAEQAAENLRKKHPGCQIVGTRDGYFSPEQDLEVAQQVAEHEADIVFVAMGIPRQEKFIAKTKDVLKAKAAIGVGGSFDVYSGKTKRAPKLIQEVKLEWLWRVILNPRKLSKVMVLPLFVFAVLADAKKQRDK